ncbi:hypothetical protein HELRODRAFT_173665 [Helobdella robusta]|uniref:Uncharacterized protein n=1 Tax=Helobdella robusta TaxID=6412 RepID=T1F736_HELRO|nr:hypothetical protein HELRODRAFT_173665 [Helobdella robusta]ESO03374.1 hypothetical protein HELRODRAFT_173665 [Helobdella robusta]
MQRYKNKRIQAKTNEINIYTKYPGSYFQKPKKVITTNIDDDPDDDDDLLSVQHVTSASSGFRSEESASGKRRKKKNRIKDGRRNHDSDVIDGSSDGYYSKISENESLIFLKYEINHSVVELPLDPVRTGSFFFWEKCF